MIISYKLIISVTYSLFVLGMALAYKWRDRYNIRQLCIVAFFICLLVVNISAIQVFPFVNLQKYTYAVDDTVTQYEIRIVDERGQEISLDPRAVEPVRPGKITDSFIQDYSKEQRARTISHLFNEAKSYRENVESKPVVRQSTYQFPKHDVGYRWTAAELSEYGAFERVRIYRVEKTFTGDNTAVNIESEVIYEWSPNAPGTPPD